jgi:twinkle protein
VLVIDPFNKIRLKASLNKNINEYTNDYLMRIDEFARKHDILIFLIAHPTKPPSIGNDRKNYEPDFYDIKGGGEFYDMSPHGLLVHRDYTHDLVKIKVLKVKFNHLGENNAHIWLAWNKGNGRYTDFRKQADKPEDIFEPQADNSNWVIEKEKHDTQVNISFSNPPKGSEDFFTVSNEEVPF